MNRKLNYYQVCHLNRNCLGPFREISWNQTSDKSRIHLITWAIMWRWRYITWLHRSHANTITSVIAAKQMIISEVFFSINIAIAIVIFHWKIYELLCLCARLFIYALSSPAGKGLNSWFSFVVSNCEFFTFPLVSWVRCGTWLIVSIPDLCTLTYIWLSELFCLCCVVSRTFI